MGRLRFVLFKISRLFPKKQRKPFILISSILGLFIFMNVITSMTQSVYLLSVQQAILDTQEILKDQNRLGLNIILIITIIILCSYKFYSIVLTLISILYVVILILACLPYLIGG